MVSVPTTMPASNIPLGELQAVYGATSQTTA